MSKFPSAVPPHETVEHTRYQRRKQMMATATRGVLLRSAIISAELLGFVFLNSSSLLLDALSSLIDIGASLFLIFIIRLADRPPDENHPFGHGRFEPVAGLQLGLLLAAIGGGMLFQQLTALSSAHHGKTIEPYTWVIPFGAVILLEIAYRHLRRTAKQQQSPALLADAVHYRIDALNSLFATAALLLAAFFPHHGALYDHFGAILIALLMLGIGLFAGHRNLQELLDRVPAPEFFERVKTAAMRVNGVLATEKVLIQRYGPDAHVSVDIEVSPELSVDKAHGLTQLVRAEIQKEWPSVRDVIVHVEPYYPGDH